MTLPISAIAATTAAVPLGAAAIRPPSLLIGEAQRNLVLLREMVGGGREGDDLMGQVRATAAALNDVRTGAASETPLKPDEWGMLDLIQRALAGEVDRAMVSHARPGETPPDPALHLATQLYTHFYYHIEEAFQRLAAPPAAFGADALDGLLRLGRGVAPPPCLVEERRQKGLHRTWGRGLVLQSEGKTGGEVHVFLNRMGAAAIGGGSRGGRFQIPGLELPKAHAAFLYRRGRYEFYPLEGRPQITVNGKRARLGSAISLKTGDRIGIGQKRFTVRLPTPPRLVRFARQIGAAKSLGDLITLLGRVDPEAQATVAGFLEGRRRFSEIPTEGGLSRRVCSLLERYYGITHPGSIYEREGTLAPVRSVYPTFIGMMRRFLPAGAHDETAALAMFEGVVRAVGTAETPHDLFSALAVEGGFLAARRDWAVQVRDHLKGVPGAAPPPYFGIARQSERVRRRLFPTEATIELGERDVMEVAQVPPAAPPAPPPEPAAAVPPEPVPPPPAPEPAPPPPAEPAAPEPLPGMEEPPWVAPAVADWFRAPRTTGGVPIIPPEPAEPTVVVAPEPAPVAPPVAVPPPAPVAPPPPLPPPQQFFTGARILAGEGVEGKIRLITGRTEAGEFAATTDQGIGYDDVNEDAVSVAVGPDGSLFLFDVDGMGGHGGGKLAAQQAVEAATAEAETNGDLVTALQAADEAILAHNRSHYPPQDRRKPGAVMAGAGIIKPLRAGAPYHVRFHWAGDARGMILGRGADGRWQWFYRTVDDGLGFMLRLGEAYQRGGEGRTLITMASPGASVVTNHLGMESPSRRDDGSEVINRATIHGTGDGEVPDRSQETGSGPATDLTGGILLEEGDLVLLGSDGFWENFGHTRIILDIIQDCRTAKEVVLTLTRVAHTRMRILTEAERYWEGGGTGRFAFRGEGGRTLYIEPNGSVYAEETGGERIDHFKRDNFSLVAYLHRRPPAPTVPGTQ